MKRSLPPVGKPLEDLAVNLLLESYGEHRYNRSPEDYERLCALIPPLKVAHHRVNQQLKKHHDRGTFREWAICDFRGGDQAPNYRSYPDTISIQTVRNGLERLRFRAPKGRRHNRK